VTQFSSPEVPLDETPSPSRHRHPIIFAT